MENVCSRVGARREFPTNLMNVGKCPSSQLRRRAAITSNNWQRDNGEWRAMSAACVLREAAVRAQRRVARRRESVDIYRQYYNVAKRLNITDNLHRKSRRNQNSSPGCFHMPQYISLLSFLRIFDKSQHHRIIYQTHHLNRRLPASCSYHITY